MFSCSFGCCWSLAVCCFGLSTFGRHGSVSGAGSEFLSLRKGSTNRKPSAVGQRGAALPVCCLDRLGCLSEPTGKPMKRRSRAGGGAIKGDSALPLAALIVRFGQAPG